MDDVSQAMDKLRQSIERMDRDLKNTSANLNRIRNNLSSHRLPMDEETVEDSTGIKGKMPVANQLANKWAGIVKRDHEKWVSIYFDEADQMIKSDSDDTVTSKEESQPEAQPVIDRAAYGDKWGGWQCPDLSLL